MYKIIAIWFLIFFALPANGQSNKKMVFRNALEKDKKMQISGKLLTVIGGTALLTGNIMYYKIYDEYGNTDPPKDKLKTSGYIMAGGLGLMSAGIPLWVIGIVKERQITIEAKLINTNGTASVNGVGLKIRF